MKQNPIRQVVFPILAALIWGTAFVAQDVCADTIGTFTFNAARYAIAVLALLVLYYLVPKRFQWVVLLIGSYAFYAFVCLRYMGFIVVTTLTTYFGARGMDAMTARMEQTVATHKQDWEREERKAYKKRCKSRRKALMIAILLLLSLIHI